MWLDRGQTLQNIAVAIACRPLVTTAGSCHRLDRIPRSWATDQPSGANLPINLLSITRRFQWCMSVGTSTTWNIYLEIPLAFFFGSSMDTVLFWRDPYRRKQKKLIRQKDRHVLRWIFILGFYKVSWESFRRSNRSPERDGTRSLGWTKGYTRELATWGIFILGLLTFYVFDLLELHFFLHV